MSALPAWKIALLERKKKQEEEAKAKQAQVEEAKLASLPSWKRAIVLREKQAKGVLSTINRVPPTTTENNKKPRTFSNKWQVAVERIKGPDSPILNQKPKWKNPTSPPKQDDAAAIATKNQPMQRWKNATSPPKQDDAAAIATKNQPMQRWKNATSPPKQDDAAAIATKNPSMQRWKHSTPTSSGSATVAPVTPKSPSAAPPTAPASEEDASLLRMPAWKRALILKKREQQQKTVESTENVKSTSKLSGGEDEPDSVTPASSIATVPAPQQPEVVNRTGVDVPTQRLVEQEGKTLHAPVYKEVDEWANVREEDDKFQSLPLWKQALIKRRRADIAKRSGMPVTQTTPTMPKNSPLTAPEQKVTTNNHSRKLAVEQKKKVGQRYLSSSHSQSKPTSTPTKAAEGQTPVTELFKPARKAPLPPSTKNTITKEEDAMFTYNFSKSTRHTLDTGGSSSDSTDSELEDAVVTNLDESSDEGDSGIVLQHYSATKPSSSSPSLGQKSQSESSVGAPITTTGKKKGKHLRRVSWSDTALVSEHFYPKYDYSDYDEIEQGATNGGATNGTSSSNSPSTENSGLSHRLHPSLRPNNESDPYAYGFSSPRSPASDNSLSTFIPKALSSYSPQIVSSYSAGVAANNTSKALEEVTAEEETDDFYADLTSNTAALLW